MAVDIFDFKPADVPEATRGLRRSKYLATVDAISEYLQDHSEQQSVKIELGDVSIKSAVSSFRNAISKRYPDTLRLLQRGGDLYIERV
jgi:hypothetical protein